MRPFRVLAAMMAGFGFAAAACSLAIPFDSLTGGDGSAPPPTDGPAADTTVPTEGGSSCRRNCLGAPCVNNACVPIDIASGQAQPQGIALDGDQVLFTNLSPAGLYRIPKAGGTRARIDEVVDIAADPWDIAADATHYYWSEYKQNVVFRKPRVGGAKQQLGSCSGQCAWIVVAGGQVYATDYFVKNQSPPGTVISMPAAGGNSLAFVPNQPLAAGLATSNGILYWARGGEAGSIQAIMLASDAGTAQGAASLGVPLTGLAADGDDLYVIAEGRRIVHTRRGDNVPGETIYEAPTPFGDGDLALDAEAIYWTEPTTGLVRKTGR
jgi:hypothetical protein